MGSNPQSLMTATEDPLNHVPARGSGVSGATVRGRCVRAPGLLSVYAACEDNKPSVRHYSGFGMR